MYHIYQIQNINTVYVYKHFYIKSLVYLIKKRLLLVIYKVQYVYPYNLLIIEKKTKQDQLS
jgi:hypothetical protein